MPTKQVCSMTRPCECGLWRPKRLFGFDDGTAGGAPSSRTVSRDQEENGLPPTFTRPSVVPGRSLEIQEEIAHARSASHRARNRRESPGAPALHPAGGLAVVHSVWRL